MNPTFMRKVVYADAISMCTQAARQIISSITHVTDAVGAPLGYCNDFVADALVSPVEIAAWTLLTSDNPNDYSIAKVQVLNSSARFMVSQAECVAQAACTGSSALSCQILGETIKAVQDGINDVIFLANTLAGTYDASASLAYDERNFSPYTVQGPCQDVQSQSPLGTTLYGQQAIGCEGDLDCWSDVFTAHGIRISPGGCDGRAYYDYGPVTQESVTVTFEWVDNAWFSDTKALDVMNWDTGKWEQIASWSGNDGKDHISSYNVPINNARIGPSGQVRVALFGASSSVIHLNTITVK